MKNTAKKIISEGCVIFTCITVAVYSLGMLISDSEKSFIPSLKFIYLFLIFSLLVSAANQLLHCKKIKPAVGILIHFAVCFLMYFICVVLCGGFISSGAQTLISLSAFVLIYAVFAVIWAIIRSCKKRKLSDKKEYVSQFK